MPDHDRPLNKRGRQAAPRMGQLLVEAGLIPDLIVSSTATRARQTVEFVAKSCNYSGVVEYDADLYCDSAIRRDS